VIITTERKDYPIVDLQEVASQHDDAVSAIRSHRHIRRWTETTTGRKLTRALGTIPILCDELTRLRDRLARTVADLQNLIAAARATLGAHTDGEDDPLYYLRDELEAQGQLPSHHQERP
jgi:hypothetical protein